MKNDTKWRLRDSEGKEYIIIDSEKVDMQEELNKMIAKQMKEIERLNNIINKAIEYIEQPDNIQSVAFCREDGEIMNLYKIDGAKSLELLDILKGSNNEKDK